MAHRTKGVAAAVIVLATLPAAIAARKSTDPGPGWSVAHSVQLPFCEQSMSARPARRTPVATPGAGAPSPTTLPDPPAASATPDAAATGDRATATAAATPDLWLGIAALECGGTDEVVLLANVGVTEGDVAGWSLRSVEGNQVLVLASRRLPAGESVAVHSGPGAPPTGDRDIRWTLSYIWNNVSDRAQLISPAGIVVQEEDC